MGSNNNNNNNLEKINFMSRAVGNTEQNWIRAVAGGTGITVLTLQMARPSSDITFLYGALQKLVQTHPLLRSKLHYDHTAKEFYFHFSSTAAPPPEVRFYDVLSTGKILQTGINSENVSPLNLISERELNDGGEWFNPHSIPFSGVQLFFPSLYALSDTKCVVALRLHAAVCDRTTAVSLLRELMALVAEGGGAVERIENDGEGNMGIEGLVPKELTKKTIWARGKDVLGYSVNSLRQTNLNFKDTKWPRRSEIVRLHINKDVTQRILAGCKSRGIKLCSALTAAGLIATHSTKLNSDQLITKRKYGVVTLIDCRSLLQPPLSTHHFGVYHSNILNIHTVKGKESLWDLAESMYKDLSTYKKCNRHFSDMADLYYLMCKAIDNPTLTPSSSLRTSLLVVFEDPVIENSDQMQQQVGLEDFVGCASAHGVGPSIGLFDIIRNGELDCVCVYPAPLHSREQMNELIDGMKRILIHGSTLA